MIDLSTTISTITLNIEGLNTAGKGIDYDWIELFKRYNYASHKNSILNIKI